MQLPIYYKQKEFCWDPNELGVVLSWKNLIFSITLDNSWIKFSFYCTEKYRRIWSFLMLLMFLMKFFWFLPENLSMFLPSYLTTVISMRNYVILSVTAILGQYLELKELIPIFKNNIDYYSFDWIFRNWWCVWQVQFSSLSFFPSSLG